MNKSNTHFLYPLAALVILIFALAHPLFDVPPIGKLLDPFIGIIRNGDNNNNRQQTLFVISKTGAGNPVQVFFDDRQVPHIYARNITDLYFAQGYVTASLRLWQMDFLSYVAAGRLSELFANDQFLDYDRNQRRIGITEAARKSLALIREDSTTNAVLNAYTNGVNAYIKQLRYKDEPLEYKLLDYTPEPWTDLKTVLILKQMGNTLSGYEEDMFLSKMMLALGEKDFNTLYPDFPSRSTPIAFAGKGNSVPPPYMQKPDYLTYAFLSSKSFIPDNGYIPKLGSNSWAVSGSKTATGYPILCSDPHLNLSLPCIWLEMQLSCPDMNVYGVSIPGTPAVIIGFNKDIAWGVTNGADDVKDWYKLKITDDYKRYAHNGRWLDLPYRIDTIKRKQQTPFYDTVYSTLQGPILTTRNFSGYQPELLNYALQWTLHQPSNEFKSFIKINTARNYADFKAAIKDYHCPVQNFTFACKDNTIALHHQGLLNIKWPLQGKFILDGGKKEHLYSRSIPTDSLPHVVNPECNYVLSANQRPTDAGYPYYYNGYYTEPRAARIRQVLEQENAFTVKKMEALQLDNTNLFAATALPVLISQMDTGKLTTTQQQALTGLCSWKGTYDANDRHAKLFELWWNNISRYTWDELKQYAFFVRPPDNYVLLDLIQQDPGNQYFDILGTSTREHAPDVITAAFTAAADELMQMQKAGKITWGDFNKVNIMHLTNLPALSRSGLSSAGHPDAINAVSSGWGPSWRMIVALGERPEAYGIYPGGQSGNPGSSYYDNFIDDWNKGRYYRLQFFMSINEARSHAVNTWLIK